MSLVDELDALPAGFGRYPTCESLQQLSSEAVESIRRNLKRGVSSKSIVKILRANGVRIGEDRFRDHVKEVCPRCQISFTS